MIAYLRPLKHIFLRLTGSWGKHLLFLLKMKIQTRSLNRTFIDCSLIRADVFFFIMDKRLKQPGLADRLKAIISCYYIAKINNFEFYIVADDPYDMSSFLESSHWGKMADLEFSKKNTLTYNYVPWLGLPHFPKGKQIHCINYMGHSIFSQLKSDCPEWSVLFEELFKPSPILQKKIHECNLPNGGYIAVHLRFVNSLEDFEVYHQNRLTCSEKTTLIEKCKKALKEICDENRLKVYVFSDSKIFLNSLCDLPVYTLDFGNVGHVGNKESGSKVMEKTLVDFYVMSRSVRVYRIVTKGLYPSDFCKYAAKMGNVQFEERNI